MNSSNINFQTFFVSNDITTNPLFGDFIKIITELEKGNLIKNNNFTVSIKYGKRLLINSNNISFKEISKQDIVEIVDYDPLKKIFLAIGKKIPSIDAPVHWIIQNARSDINAIVELSEHKLNNKTKKGFIEIEKEYLRGTIDLAKEILKTLRSSKNIFIKNNGVIMVGINSDDIIKTIRRISGD